MTFPRLADAPFCLPSGGGSARRVSRLPCLMPFTGCIPKHTSYNTFPSTYYPVRAPLLRPSRRAVRPQSAHAGGDVVSRAGASGPGMLPAGGAEATVTANYSRPFPTRDRGNMCRHARDRVRLGCCSRCPLQHDAPTPAHRARPERGRNATCHWAERPSSPSSSTLTRHEGKESKTEMKVTAGGEARRAIPDGAETKGNKKESSSAGRLLGGEGGVKSRSPLSWPPQSMIHYSSESTKNNFNTTKHLSIRTRDRRNRKTNIR